MTGPLPTRDASTGEIFGCERIKKTMYGFENNRAAPGDHASKDSIFECGTSGDLRRPFIDATGQAGHVDPKSQPGGMQMLLNMAYQEGSRLKAKLTGGVGVGDPKDYQPAKIAEHRFSQDDIEQLKLEKAKNQGATASSSDANHGASSDSEEVYYHSDDDWTVVADDVTYRLLSKPKNPEKEVQPNDPVIYQNELLREGYRPKPPQGLLEHIVRSLLPSWKRTNSMIEVINSEQNSERYRNQLNEAIVKDVELAKSVAKGFFREDIEAAKNELYEQIDKEKNKELMELKMKSQMFKVKSELSLQEIRIQESKLREIREQKEENKLKLQEIRKLREEDMKEHQDKKDKILQNIKKCEDKLRGLKEQKAALKTDKDEFGNDQEIEQNEKELKSLKEQKIKELEEIAKYKKRLQQIEYLEDNLQKIKQCEEKLQALKKARDEFAIEVFKERLAQNQEYAADRLLKELDAIEKKYGKSLQWLRLNLFRSNGIRF